MSTLPADYRDLGQRLRDTREGMGLTLDQVTHGTRIRLAFLEALESGEMGTIPGTVYARGYLKTYADYLGYDGASMLGTVTAAPAPRQETKYLPPERSDRERTTMAAVALSLLALLGIVVWQWQRSEPETPPKLVEALPEHLSYLLDRGTPRLPVSTPSRLCREVAEGVAQALCAEEEPVAARAMDEPDLPRSLLAWPARFPSWHSPIVEATPVATSETPHYGNQPLWMNPFRR